MKKIIVILMSLFLVGCSLEKKDKELESTKKTRLTFNRPEEPFTGLENTYWYKDGVSRDLPNGWNGLKIYASSNPHTLIVRGFIIDKEQTIYDKSFRYERPVNNVPNAELEVELPVEYLGETPYFYVSEGPGQTKFGETIFYNGSKKEVYERAGSISTLEGKYINMYTNLYFISENGDIRETNLYTLTRWINFGISDIRDKELYSEDDMAKEELLSKFHDEEVAKYLNEKYGVIDKDKYLSIEAVAEYLMNDNGMFEKIYQLNNDKYMGTNTTNGKTIEKKGSEKRYKELNKIKYNGTETYDEIIKRLEPFEAGFDKDLIQ